MKKNNMVLKFDDFVNEGFLSKTINRSKSGDLRHEDGKKVMTSLGVEMIVKNNCDYEWFIKEICDHTDIRLQDLKMLIFHLRDYSTYEQKNIKSGTLDYVHMLPNNLVASFPEYDGLVDNSVFDEDELSEEDYISICKCIVESLQDKNIVYAYNVHMFKLVDEDMLLNVWEKRRKQEENGKEFVNTIFDDFESELHNHFSKDVIAHIIENEIYFVINHYSIVNYDEIEEFTYKWFGI